MDASESLRVWIEASPDREAMVYACQGVVSFATLMENLLPPLIRTLLRESDEASHVLSLKDEEYADRLQEALDAAHWKGRARDRKGQLFKMKFERGVLLGWSAQTHSWTFVVPESLQKVLFDWLKHFYLQCDSSTREAYSKYTESLKRDYSATQGQRAHTRGLHELSHRQGLVGRRNKFVPVPKVF